MSTAHASPPVSHPTPVSWGRLLWGVALLGAGTLWLLDVTNVAGIRYLTVIALALIGLGIVIPFVPTHQNGAVVLGLVLTALAFTTVMAGRAVDPALLRRGAGDLRVAPAAVEQLHRRYEHGAGDVTLDLRHLAFPVGVTRTGIHLGAGELDVRLPDDVSVRIHASAGVGEVVVLGRQRSGVEPALDTVVRGHSSERVLDLEATVGVGSIEVTR
jgi:predicted membrane protein